MHHSHRITVLPRSSLLTTEARTKAVQSTLKSPLRVRIHLLPILYDGVQTQPCSTSFIGGFHFSRVSVTSNSLFEPDDKSNTTALDAVSEINVPPPQQSRSNQPSALSTRSTSAAGGAVSAQPQSSTSVGDTHLLDAMWRKVEYVSQVTASFAYLCSACVRSLCV